MCDVDLPVPAQPPLDLGLPCQDCDALLPIPAGMVDVGDWVTELSTPCGPWYRIEAVDRDAGIVTLDAGGGLYVPCATTGMTRSSSGLRGRSASSRPLALSGGGGVSGGSPRRRPG